MRRCFQGFAADLTGDATHAFDVLRTVLRRMHGDRPETRAAVVLDALSICSTLHGLAGVMNGPCIDHVAIEAKELKQAAGHATDRMRPGLVPLSLHLP